mmetsp:Transcript_48148/g.104847  ORF Transcript_48148/g.104847 Transcript_48148/m.104847 type:complete len:503 (-) Transcript_48148:65-1573(-)|eukprot:CAMPEP_0170591210 /NCGR_PEP_ID=MMETSP0224-20130122/12282_1 /TAXON_ID=285029 /ORGANISM="Togula jolla, Strain CCCM 725" /LENGTH=502 /DNA_ID=CAMNT_0010915059 /DNA_START=45 /DNA_END=1553 /DNA_ORIENTATION=+
MSISRRLPAVAGLATVAIWMLSGPLQTFASLHFLMPSASGHTSGHAGLPVRSAPSRGQGSIGAGAPGAMGSRAVVGALGLAALGAAFRLFGRAQSSRRGIASTPIARRVVTSVALPNGPIKVTDTAISYAEFLPRLYNWCKSLGMTPGRIVPSIGFCADENQGYATTLILKHFGTWPFNHGYIGGILALDRHGPHAAHGEDMVIFVAPHVGYDPDLLTFGSYRRNVISNPGAQISTCCGKVAGVLAPYREQYEKTLGRIRVKVQGETVLVSLSDSISLDMSDGHYIVLNYDKLLESGSLENPVAKQSTGKVYKASGRFAADIREAFAIEGATKKGEWRTLEEPTFRKAFKPSMFSFKAPPLDGEENRLERLLLPHMPFVLNGPCDAELMSAMTACQAEFGRTVHSVEYAPAYQGKNLIVISGVNVDVSPRPGDDDAFPATVFLPWSAYVQVADGRRRMLEQAELIDALMEQSDVNLDAIDIEQCIEELFSTKRQVNFYDNAS